MALKWTFAPTDGGRETGLNDPGVETFKGNFDRYLARELIQNSLDARHDSNKPVSIKFSLLQLARGSVPGCDELTLALTRCAEFWNHDRKSRVFFEGAATIAQSDRITALRVSDYNTTGVLGSDTEKTRNWYNLIRSGGASSKGSGEGGSFGIGKNAPFAASRVRTVFYSTKNTDNEVIFQGVATLASHKLDDGRVAQNVGFFGGERGASVRSLAMIPPEFRRESFGTDITIVGFPATDAWDRDLVYSVLDNFWPAIHFGDLQVTVGTTEITQSTLPALLEAYSGLEEFTAHLYYTAFIKASHPFLSYTLPKLGEVSLYLVTGDKDFPKRVAMVRRTGMVIYAKQFRSVLPFCGVFFCRNETGNRLLREMEPPRHDVWDPDHPEKGANRKLEAEYVGFIRECIKKLTPTDDSTVIAVPGLSRFLPDDDETPETTFEAQEDQPPQESETRRPLPERINGQPMALTAKSTQPDSTTQDEKGQEPTDIDGDEGGKKRGKKKKNGGLESDDSGDVGTGKEGGAGSKAAIPVRYRTFATNVGAGVYQIAINPSQPVAGPFSLVFGVVGDDAKDKARLKSARFLGGAAAPLVRGCEIGPIDPPASWPLRMEVVLSEPMSVAMEVHAHEA